MGAITKGSKRAELEALAAFTPGKRVRYTGTHRVVATGTTGTVRRSIKRRCSVLLDLDRYPIPFEAHARNVEIIKGNKS